MPATLLQSWLAREGLVSAAELKAAAARQAVYGGTLDTALLEAGALTENALWARLAAATGLPVPAPALCDGSGPPAAALLPADGTRAMGAVPVAADPGTATAKILCRESAPVDAIRAAARAQGFEARLFVVPEVRLLAMRQRVYGERLPARYATLLARMLGPTRARTGFLPQAGATNLPRPAVLPPPPPPPPPRPPTIHSHEVAPSGAEPVILMPDPPSGPVHLALLSSLSSQAGPSASPEPGALDMASPEQEQGQGGAAQGSDAVPEAPIPELVSGGDSTGAATESLCRRARDRSDKGRLLAARALRRRLGQPVVAQLLESLRAEVADPDRDEGDVVAAIETLAEARDPAAVPVLIDRLGREPAGVVTAVHAALVALCATDLGTSRRRWASWARGHAERPRVEWLLDGLAHKQPELRLAAAEELRQLAGDSFGYLFDLPKRDREAARKRFVAWWEGISVSDTRRK